MVRGWSTRHTRSSCKNLISSAFRREDEGETLLLCRATSSDDIEEMETNSSYKSWRWDGTQAGKFQLDKRNFFFFSLNHKGGQALEDAVQRGFYNLHS